MKIAFVSSEVVPFAKTGGLADVAGSLPVELAKLGVDVKVFMPKYYSIDERKYNLHYDGFIGSFPVRIAGYDREVKLFRGFLPGSSVEIIFIDHPTYFHRHQIYTNDFDEDERFMLFSKAVIESLQRLKFVPDVIHCNDWQTGLIPLYVKDNYSWDRMFDKTAFLYTIHNVAYQGAFSKETLWRGELNQELFDNGMIQHNGAVNFMKAAIFYSEMINTVSPTYAAELMTEEYGAGMQEYLKIRRDSFVGILNGVDYDVWDPDTDKHLPFHYNIDSLTGKGKNKEYLLNQIKLPFLESIPLIGIVTRLASQKGIDLLEQVIWDLLSLNAQWVVLGAGESKYEELFQRVAKNYPRKFYFYQGYNNELAHLIEAGADIFLMPSNYEPCGLNQIYSLRYGTVPVVRKTGGLADTVQDWNELNSFGKDTGTGFSFESYSGYALLHSVKRSIQDYNNKPVWKKIQLNGMRKEFSWKRSAEKYLDLYKLAASKRQ